LHRIKTLRRLGDYATGKLVLEVIARINRELGTTAIVKRPLARRPRAGAASSKEFSRPLSRPS
jgi:hypothetical protein